MLSWCHGAPGILIARHVMKEAGMADTACESELGVARASTLALLAERRGSSVDVAAHLCCGLLGLTSLLRLDALASGLSLEPVVASVESSLMTHAGAGAGYTFFSVDQGSLSLPGLFMGKAGVALALLEAPNRELWLPAVLSAGLLN